jgi:hypothetical protein
MHTTKKERRITKKKSYYGNLFLGAAVLTPPRQHQKVSKVPTLKTIPSTRTMPGTTN